MVDEDPAGDRRAAPGWPSIRRLLLQMLALGVVVDLLALAWLGATGTPLGLHLVLALTLAILGTLALAGLLMGLLFHSSRAGFDAAADDRPDRPRE